MRKLEEFVFEKLKITNKAISIHTTLRKFIAWFEEEDEFRISKFNIEIRNYISSDKSMSKRKITNFLYKHLDDKIDVIEEEKRARNDSNGALYNYSFDIEDITFSIDAKIYNDSELLSRSKDYIIEKLKVSANVKKLVPFEKINILKFAKALHKSGTIFIKDYTDDLISDIRYSKQQSKYYNEMYLYSIEAKDTYELFPDEIEFEYRTKDGDGLRREYIRDESELELLSKYAEGDFNSLLEKIYTDIV